MYHGRSEPLKGKNEGLRPAMIAGSNKQMECNRKTSTGRCCCRKEVSNTTNKEEQTIGIELPAMEKDQLFPSVMTDGTLPRKTFSMGHACEKRYYIEGRKIQR